MIIPEVKRVVRVDRLAGKTIAEVREKGFCLRIVFTDGTFADLETDETRVVLHPGPERKKRPYH